MIQLTPDSDTSIHTACGENLEVSLTEIPSTGYRWDISLPRECELLDNVLELRSRVDANKEPLIGSSTKRIFRIKLPTIEMLSEIHFHLHRPWEKNVYQHIIVKATTS